MSSIENVNKSIRLYKRSFLVVVLFLLLVFLLFPIVSEAATATYNFSGVTNSNHGDGTNPIATEHDSDVFPWTTSNEQNDSANPSDAEYVNISADNSSEWVTDDPGNNDEMAITFKFFIQETITNISDVQVKWNGNTEDTSTDISIWLRKDGFDEFGGTDTWVQLGSSETVVAGVDEDVKSLSNYIKKSENGIKSQVYGEIKHLLKEVSDTSAKMKKYLGKELNNLE